MTYAYPWSKSIDCLFIVNWQIMVPETDTELCFIFDKTSGI